MADVQLAELALLPLADRRRAFLQLVKDGDLPFRRTAIVLAIGTEETGMTTGIPRNARLPFPVACYPSRQSLILERGAAVFNSNLIRSWREDPEVMQMLRQNNFLTALSGSDRVAADVTNPPDVFNPPDRTSPNDRLAFIFEWLMDRRKTAALAAFSVGPTQTFLNMGEAPEIDQDEMVSLRPITGRFRSIEHLASFYFAATAKELILNSHFDYLSTTSRYYPTDSFRQCRPTQITREQLFGNPNTGLSPDPAIAGCIEAYLQAFQTSALNWNATRGTNIAKQILEAVKSIWALARQMGIPVDSAT